MQATIEYKNFVRYVSPFVQDKTASNIYATNLGYSARPQFYNLNAGRMCRAKAEDMDTCLDQNLPTLCNGTKYETYLFWWINDPGGYSLTLTGRATGTGITKAFHAVVTSVCGGRFRFTEGGVSKPTVFECPEDSDRLQRFAFFRDVRQTGCGFSGYGSEEHSKYNDSSNVWVVIDKDTLVYTYNNIASGAHVPNPFNMSEFVFKVNYDSSEPATKALLFFGNQVIELQPEFVGESAIVYTSPNMSDVPEECVPYAFWFEYDEIVERYPEKGSFLTYGLGSCTEDYRELECVDGECCNAGLQLLYPSTRVCAEESGCAEASLCPGDSDICPEQTVKAKGELCGDPNALCQFQGKCDGTSKECPEMFKPNTTLCGKSNVDCVEDYFCTGTSNTCNKTDVFQPGGSICSAGKCSGFDTTCSRKIGTVTVKFGMDKNVTSQELADGIVEVILGGNKDGLLRIEKTDTASGISVTVGFTNLNHAQVFYDGLKKAGKLGDFGAVTDVSIRDMFETISATSHGVRARVSVLMVTLVFLFVFLFTH